MIIDYSCERCLDLNCFSRPSSAAEMLPDRFWKIIAATKPKIQKQPTNSNTEKRQSPRHVATSQIPPDTHDDNDEMDENVFPSPLSVQRYSPQLHPGWESGYPKRYRQCEEEIWKNQQASLFLFSPRRQTLQRLHQAQRHSTCSS
ncbi:hypothetical protein BLNAU_17107 [Blattamonas nauphoetae]|uniref:Uncharacterized protein n=1 Tax=Blattamonas nauphoetae TaxID=2049346 RepID=A0ABQ9X7X9_9EUKA|nr:hypothetical protein BLNAU_17107 [Blattamonas nauphoetae]